MSITGKFVPVADEGFTDLMVKEGYPANRLAEWKNEKNNVEFKVDGQKIIYINSFANRPSVKTEFTLGSEFEEKVIDGQYKSIATLEGNVLKVASKNDAGSERSRSYKFSDTGMEIVIQSSKGQGKLIYKRE